jgi:hypothetical protein
LRGGRCCFAGGTGSLSGSILGETAVGPVTIRDDVTGGTALKLTPGPSNDFFAVGDTADVNVVEVA